MKYLIKGLLLLSIIGLFLYCTKDDPDNPDQPLLGWVGGSSFDGYGVILHTTDGGKNWARQGAKDVIPDVGIDHISAVNENIVWACGDSVDGQPSILKTIDGGKNWERLKKSRNIPVVNYGGIDGVDEKIAWAVGDNNIIIKTIDGGATWVRQDEGTYPDLIFNSICVVDENHVWAVGNLNNPYIAVIYYTSDGGEHWYRQGENYIPSEIFAFIDVHASGPNDAWAVGTGKGAIRTQDGGQTWEVMNPPAGQVHINGVCMVDKDNVWLAIDYGQVDYYSGPSGQWTHYDLKISPGAIYPNTIGGTALSKDTVWMVTSAGGVIVQGEIFYTDNGGTTWTKQEIPVVSSFRRITFPKGVR